MNPIGYAAIAAIVWAAIGLATCTARADVVIRHDMGGDVNRTAQRIAALRDSGETVRIVGTCASACTMHVGLPSACVARTAVLGFHGAKGRGKFAALAEAAANGTLAAHYPTSVRAHFWAHWSKVNGDQIYWLTGEQMISLGVPECQA